MLACIAQDKADDMAINLKLHGAKNVPHMDYRHSRKTQKTDQRFDEATKRKLEEAESQMMRRAAKDARR